MTGAGAAVTGDASLKQSIGISVDGMINILGGTVLGTGGNSTGKTLTYGVCCYGVVAEAGSLTGTGGTADTLSSYGIYVANGDVDISGTAIVKGEGKQSTGMDSFGLTVSDGALTVADTATLTGIGGQAGLSSSGIGAKKSITITGGTVEGTGGAAGEYSNGVISDGTISVSGSAVMTGTGGVTTTYNSNGVCADGSAITVADTATLTGIAGDAAMYSDGIICASGSITVSGGTVKGTAGAAGAIYTSGGIYAGSITISGGSVTAQGKSYAMNEQPDLGTLPWYKWRKASSDTYNRSVAAPLALAGTAPYDTYVAIAPDSVYFTTQPQDVTVTAGSISGALTAAAKGASAGTVTYKWWQCDDANASNSVFKADGASFTIPTDLAAGSYYYYCVAILNNQIAASRTAKVTVSAATTPTTPRPFAPASPSDPTATDPAITDPTQSKAVTVTAGKAAALSVTAQNATGYQWYVNRGDGSGFVAISGATGASYTTPAVTPANGGYRYYCRAYNGALFADSAIFTLTVIEDEANPETGDNSMLGLLTGLAMLSAAGLAASVVLERRKRQSN